jgi:hypothetical protein
METEQAELELLANIEDENVWSAIFNPEEIDDF